MIINIYNISYNNSLNLIYFLFIDFKNIRPENSRTFDYALTFLPVENASNTT